MAKSVPSRVSAALLCAMLVSLTAQTKVDPKVFDNYVGRYELRPNFILNITRDGDRLLAQATGQSFFEIAPDGDSAKEFVAKGPAIRITFVTDDHGRATELVLHQGGRDTPAKRIEGEPEKPKLRTAITVDPKILARYVGQYQMTPSMVMSITLEGGHLFTQAGGQQRIEIFPETERDFFIKQFDTQFTFAGGDGPASEFVLHQAGRNLTIKRIKVVTAESLKPSFAQIDAMVAAAFEKRPVGSVTVGVVLGKDLLWTKSYGDADMEKRTPADPDTVYRIGSITKMFTSLMLQQLVEAGKVHYSDPVEKYFPEVKAVTGRFPDAPPITLVQLATHTSGLDREPENAETYVSGGPPSAWEKTLIAALPHLRYRFEPGIRFLYSNMGFAILGAALSRAAGQPYMEYIPQHVLEPLGMTHSGLERTDKMLPHLSKGYQVGTGGIDSETPQKEHEGRGYKMPNGAMYTTVADLAHFASFLMGDGPETVLRTASLQRWLGGTAVPADIELTSGYGQGYEVSRRDGYVSFGHSGAVAGWGAALFMNRKTHVGVIVLASSQGTQVNPQDLAERSLDLLSK